MSIARLLAPFALSAFALVARAEAPANACGDEKGCHCGPAATAKCECPNCKHDEAGKCQCSGCQAKKDGETKKACGCARKHKA